MTNAHFDQERRHALIGLAAALTGLFLFGLSRPVKAQDVTGTLSSSGSAVTFSLANMPSAVVQLTGTWSGRVAIDATVDGGATWQPISATSPITGARIADVTANGMFVLQNVGFTGARVRAAIWGGGTAAVAITRGFVGSNAPAVQPVQLTQSLSTLPTPTLGFACNALTRAAGQCK